MVRFLRKFKRKLYRELYRMFRFCLVVVLLVSSISFTSNAEVEEPIYDMSNIYTMNMSRPAIDENSGYLNVLLEHKTTGFDFVYCIFWHQFSSDERCLMDITLNQNSIVFYGYTFDTTILSMASDGKDSPNILPLDDIYYVQYTLPITDYNIKGWQVFGNYGLLDITFSLPTYYVDFDVLFAEDSLEIDLLAKLYRCMDAIMKLDSDIWSNLMDVLSSCENIEDYLSTCVSYLNSIDDELEDIGISLDEINSKYDQLLQYERNKYTLLTNMKNKVDSIAAAISAIKTSIDKFFKSQNSTDLKEQEFNNNINNSSSQLSNLNSQNQVTKVDASSATGNVDSNIDFNAMSSYGVVLSSITNHQSIVPYLLVIFAVALVAYVLFGKKG